MTSDQTPETPVVVRASAAPSLFAQSGMIVIFFLLGAATVVVGTGQSLDTVVQAVVSNQATLLPVGAYLSAHAWRWWVAFKRERLIVWLAHLAPNKDAVVVGHQIGKG